MHDWLSFLHVFQTIIVAFPSSGLREKSVRISNDDLPENGGIYEALRTAVVDKPAGPVPGGVLLLYESE